MLNFLDEVKSLVNIYKKSLQYQRFVRVRGKTMGESEDENSWTFGWLSVISCIFYLLLTSKES